MTEKAASLIVSTGNGLIVLQHPTETSSEFRFQQDGTYTYTTDYHSCVRQRSKWKLEHDTLYFSDYTITANKWMLFWSNEENTKLFYDILSEWVEIDNILLGPEVTDV